MPTVTALLSEIRDIVDEPVAAEWSDLQLRKWINEANRDLARVTRHYKGNHTIAVIPGQVSYPVPTSVLAIEVAWYREDANDVTVELDPVHLDTWSFATGSYIRAGRPTHYTTRGHSPSLQFVVNTAPDVAADEFILATAELPTAFAINGDDDGDDIEVPPGWYDALADYAEFKSLRRDRDPRWQEAYQLYQDKRDALLVTGQYHPASAEMRPTARGHRLPTWLTEFDGGYA